MTTTTRALVTSPDGQWVVSRNGREVIAFAGTGGAATGRLELASDDAELAMVGPPGALIAATPEAAATKIVLHQPPYLDAVAGLELEAPARIATAHAGRVVFVTTDQRQLTIVRAADGRGLAAHPVDLGGGVVEFAVAIERNQLVIGQLRKLEVWDAVSGRPLRKLALELPPPPRSIGAAAGHLWVTRPGSDEVFVYRLSDGRPFRHYVGAPIEDVICHQASPLIVLVTPRGLVRLHCLAHSLFAVESPWQAGQPLAQLVIGDEISLLGMTEGGAEPWRVAIGGGGAPVVLESAEAASPALVTAADKLRAMRGALPHAGEAAVYESREARGDASRPSRAHAWRDPLATFGQELARGVETDLPVIAIDTELGELAHRLGLSARARRALVALYALYLVGEPGLAIARLARAMGDWSEALGQGELNALAMIDRSAGKVALATGVGDLLDGAPPREIRIVGGAATSPRAGLYRTARDGRTDAAIEAELATQLGRIAVVEGALGPALLEARLHGATAVATSVPVERPRPWPQGAGLVFVLYGTPSAWIADLPSL